MNRVVKFVALGLLFGASVVTAKEKPSAPAKTDQEPIRARVKSLFKAEYAKTDRTATLALANKLVERAGEEKENVATRYVMLSEAAVLAVKVGDIETAVRAARQIDQEFTDPDLKDMLATTFAENYGGKDRLDDYRAVAAAELSNPASAPDQAKVGLKWHEVAKQIRTETRLPLARRTRHWLCESMQSPELKGLARTEAEKACQEATADIEKADAKAGRFHLFEGKWVVKYANKYTHEYVIKADGSLAFDKCISPDGTVFVQKDQQAATLVRRNGSVLVPFARGKIIERFTLEGEKLLVARFDPASDFPKSPSNKGEGVKEK